MNSVPTRFSLAKILVLAGAGGMAPPSITRISARLKRAQGHSSIRECSGLYANSHIVYCFIYSSAGGAGQYRTPSTLGLFDFHFSSKIDFEVINLHTVGSLTIPRASINCITGLALKART